MPFDQQSAPLIIDSFAGGGGASTGIEQALGRSPDFAINHDADALALHEANHPDTIHLNSNIWDVEPLSVTKGRKVSLLWSSPDCKHFSKAKGGAPKDRNIRDLAWVIVKWAEDAKPDVILMENVEEFRTWGPICDAGKIIQGLEGTTFDLWVKRLKQAGYKLEWRELRACDYGAPTIRRRFFMVARRDGKKIRWPEPTHGDPNSEAVRSGKLKPWRTAAECIDWTLPCPSIFDTKDQIKEKHGIRAQRPLANYTQARVARGIKRYVLEAERPFVVNLTHGGRLEDADSPLKTVTGANRGEKALVTPSITKFNGGATGHAMDDPLATVTANSWIKRPGGAAPLGLITPHIATMRNAQKPFNGADEPVHTITAGGAGLYAVAPYLMSLKGTSRRASSALTPHPTVLAGGGHSAIITPVLTYAQHGGASRNAQDPHHTICANMKDQNSVIIPSMVQIGYGERKGQSPRTLDLRAPLGTVVASGSKHAPVAASLIKYYGTGDGARFDEPAHTVTTKDRFGHVQAQLAAPEFSQEHEARARAVAEFLRAHDAWDGGELVTLNIKGETFVMVDIGLRMLTPRELFNAQGFPSDYVIEGVWNQSSEISDWNFTPFTKSTQIKCCGNSVCPDLARALVEANCAHLIEEERNAA
jgi:DNA (cytosine-5)-methyltransferase 1